MKGARRGCVRNRAGLRTDRGVVDAEGAQDVAFGDGVGHRAVGSLVLVQGLHGDQGGVEGGGTFIKGHLVELLLEGGSIVVLVQDGDVHHGGGLWDMGHGVKHCGGICWAVSGAASAKVNDQHGLGTAKRHKQSAGLQMK